MILIAIIAAGLYLSNKDIESMKKTDWRTVEQEEMQELKADTVDTAEKEVVKDVTEEKRRELRKEDYRGWLSIAGTDIDYPVMQSSDNEYYLRHSYDGSVTGRGSLFLDYENTMDDANITVHGHNLGQYGMFSQLLRYQDKKFLKSNPTFLFQTNSETKEYDIFAVMVFDVNKMDQFDFSQREITADWLKYITENSLHLTDTSINCEDQIMTLSTCLYPRKTEWRVIVFGKLKNN